jgi:hypothetical protein
VYKCAFVGFNTKYKHIEVSYLNRIKTLHGTVQFRTVGGMCGGDGVIIQNVLL